MYLPSCLMTVSYITPALTHAWCTEINVIVVVYTVHISRNILHTFYSLSIECAHLQMCPEDP